MKKPQREDYNITLTVDIKESIFSYFYRARSTVSTFSNYLQRHRELDFMQMRRFLQTTYKTLKDIDPEYMANKLGMLYKRLNDISLIYDDFVKKSRIGVHSYEVIFLRQQDNYAAYEGRMTHNSDEISYLRAQTEKFKETVAEQKKRVEEASRITGQKDRQEEELKRIRRLENAAIVRLGHLMEENAILAEVLTDFKLAYEKEFQRSFLQFVKDIKPHLLSILNAIAFEFDVELWHKARGSEVIRNHFKNAYAGEVVNSKMYLEYFLRNLDPAKMNKEYKQLEVLLKHLNDTNPVNVVMYLPDAEDLRLFTNALESDKSGFQVFGYTNAKRAMENAFKERIHILIIDLDITRSVLDNFIFLYRKTMIKLAKEPKIIAVTSRINDASIDIANSLEIDALLDKEEDAIEIIDSVYELLKVDTTKYMKEPINDETS